jgi:hypothetical protein
VSLVVVERDGGVGVVLMNRPEALNALSSELMDALVGALEELDREEENGPIGVGPEIVLCSSKTRDATPTTQLGDRKTGDVGSKPELRDQLRIERRQDHAGAGDPDHQPDRIAVDSRPLQRIGSDLPAENARMLHIGVGLLALAAALNDGLEWFGKIAGPGAVGWRGTVAQATAAKASQGRPHLIGVDPDGRDRRRQSRDGNPCAM